MGCVNLALNSVLEIFEKQHAVTETGWAVCKTAASTSHL